MPRQNSNNSKTSSSPDVYVGLLFVALAGLITGCIFLYLELEKYNWQLG